MMGERRWVGEGEGEDLDRREVSACTNVAMSMFLLSSLTKSLLVFNTFLARTAFMCDSIGGLPETWMILVSRGLLYGELNLGTPRSLCLKHPCAGDVANPISTTGALLL